MKPPFPDSYWLEPGHIACGEYPREIDDQADHEGLRALLEARVRLFIDLTEEGELKPYWSLVQRAAQELGLDPATLEHRRFPIRDVSVPRSKEEMRVILRALRSARHRGLPAYLHCLGGRGRTGTVAGCMLSEIFGHHGEEALNRLTERWQACSKSAYFDSPETEEQRAFVRRWNPGGPDLRSRVRAAILGAAVGDALGVPVEFADRAARRSDPVTGMRAFGTHHQPAGTWSDDTSMLLATMAGLTGAGGYDPEAVMREFVHWVAEARHTPHGEVFDIGSATSQAIARYQSGVPWRQCGGMDEFSNGNGSLMRILPVALAYPDDPDLTRKASDISVLTHAHGRSRFCCAFYCLVASDLLHGSSIVDATEFAWEILDQRMLLSPPERVRFERLHPNQLFARNEDEIRSGGHVIDTLEAALWVNARNDSYADTVLHAVNLGHDTDTTGCVAGGLAGLFHGEGAIPDEWIEVLAQREELVRLTDLFAEFCGREAVKGSEEGSEAGR